MQLNSKTLLTVQAGMQTIQKTWGELAFVYIGSKHKAELQRIHDKLTRDGIAEWNGFALIHPEHKAA